ncbi:BnaC07g32970D [Brassica napus]|uniref:BnaC07g32970D protein n=1 Tax=Brassica napus TaxID=3708 RepID=A0A078F9R7_BRANA|nr:BnaC07g32970D [Brassica napus]
MASASLPPPPPSSTSLTSQQSSPPPSQLPIRKMPGSYGLPLVGPLTDQVQEHSVPYKYPSVVSFLR